jgi:hypothetical protein
MQKWFDAQDKPSNFQIFLDCFEADSSHNQVRAACKAADLAIVMTKFVNHSIETVMRKATQNFVRCNGGTSELGRMITTHLQSFAED